MARQHVYFFPLSFNLFFFFLRDRRRMIPFFFFLVLWSCRWSWETFFYGSLKNKGGNFQTGHRPCVGGAGLHNPLHILGSFAVLGHHGGTHHMETAPGVANRLGASSQAIRGRTRPSFLNKAVCFSPGSCLLHSLEGQIRGRVEGRGTGRRALQQQCTKQGRCIRLFGQGNTHGIHGGRAQIPCRVMLCFSSLTATPC